VCETARDRALVELLYGTGLRAGELARLELSDIAFAERAIHVRQGKGRKDRVVPLGERAAEAIVEYLRERLRRPGPLLLSRWGRPLSAVLLWRAVTRLGRAAGVVVSPHRLRHSYATHLLRHGARVQEIQALLGHGSVESTQVVSARRGRRPRVHDREKSSAGMSEPPRKAIGADSAKD
jgi:integrase/recombinase XerD